MTKTKRHKIDNSVAETWPIVLPTQWPKRVERSSRTKVFNWSLKPNFDDEEDEDKSPMWNLASNVRRRLNIYMSVDPSACAVSAITVAAVAAASSS